MDVRFTAWAGYELKATTIVSGTTSSGMGSGSIEIEPGWQLLAIPIQYGYWDNVFHIHVHDDITVAKFKNYVLGRGAIKSPLKTVWTEIKCKVGPIYIHDDEVLSLTDVKMTFKSFFDNQTLPTRYKMRNTTNKIN